MRKKIVLIFLFLLLIFSNSFGTLAIQRVYFSGNNICNYFQNSGIFNQNTLSGNTSGFFWPCGSTYTYCFTAGLCQIGKIDNKQAMFACSYKGELCPGFIPYPPPGPEGLATGASGPDFKIYTVKEGDNKYSNSDYANWYKMIPYGAPYVDVNNNCIYDEGIDIPGVKDASQTIFVCLQDASLSERNPIEGFGGGITSPYFNAEVHMTAWGYDIIPAVINNAQFIRYEIINKGNKVWDSTFFAIPVDPDVINPQLNYFGCDSSRNLAFCYLADSAVYGAYGIRVLKGPVNKETGDTIYMSSCVDIMGLDNCSDNAIELIKGYKSNHFQFLDPTFNPPRKTKFVFSGDPETNIGWTPSKGYIMNCQYPDSGTLISVNPMDVKFVVSSGAGNLKVYPGDTQTVYLLQMIASGSSNTNSVSKLKIQSDVINTIFRNEIINNFNHCISAIPGDFSLSQNFPNPFNVITQIQFNIPRKSYVKLTVYDILGKEVAVLENGNFESGYYQTSFNASNYASGIYFYRMVVIDKTVNSEKIFSRVKKMAVLK